MKKECIFAAGICLLIGAGIGLVVGISTMKNTCDKEKHDAVVHSLNAMHTKLQNYAINHYNSSANECTEKTIAFVSSFLEKFDKDRYEEGTLYTKKEMKTIEKKSTIPVFLEGLYEPMLKKGIISPPGLLESPLPTKPRKTIISTDPPVQEELKETNDILP